jgi:hypothetical protein
MRDEAGMKMRLASEDRRPRRWGYPTKHDDRDLGIRRRGAKAPKRGCRLASTTEINQVHISSTERAAMMKTLQAIVEIITKPSKRQIRRWRFSK